MRVALEAIREAVAAGVPAVDVLQACVSGAMGGGEAAGRGGGGGGSGSGRTSAAAGAAAALAPPVCSWCSRSLAGRTPYRRLEFQYCNTVCLKEHRDKLGR